MKTETEIDNLFSLLNEERALGIHELMVVEGMNHFDAMLKWDSTHAPKVTDRKKFSFIVHDPDTFKATGRFVSTTPSLAAKKAASRGFDTVHLRKAGTKIVYIYTCEEGQARRTQGRKARRHHHHVLDRFKGEAR